MTSKDEEIIEIFKGCLSLTNNVGLKSRGRNPSKIYYFLQFGDRIFYDFLLSIGLMPAKSKVLGEIKIPKEYFADFLRGCIDGDGSIGYCSHPESRWPQLKIRLFSASPVFLIWIKSEIRELFGIRGGWIQGPDGGVSALAYGSSDSILLASFLYHEGATSFLKRKYDVIVEYKGRVVELADTLALGASAVRHVGSNPTSPTIRQS